MSLTNRTKDYCFAFFLLEAILFGVFSSLDVLFFYVFFEAVLIPMFLIIGFYGSRQRRVRSAYLLFFYTLLSSLFMFLLILVRHQRARTQSLSQHVQPYGAVRHVQPYGVPTAAQTMSPTFNAQCLVRKIRIIYEPESVQICSQNGDADEHVPGAGLHVLRAHSNRRKGRCPE